MLFADELCLCDERLRHHSSMLRAVKGFSVQLVLRGDGAKLHLELAQVPHFVESVGSHVGESQLGGVLSLPL